MILSKDDLSFALNCAKQYFYDSLNSDYPNKDDRKNWELFHELEQESDNDTLEIEGYERVEWKKFDPNDSKTFPPKSDEYLVCILDDGYPMPIAAAWFNDSHKFNVSLPVSHWRHMPKPPVEKY